MNLKHWTPRLWIVKIKAIEDLLNNKSHII